MKIFFVGLVLFVGCSSGVIVPSIVSKSINKPRPTSRTTDSKNIKKIKQLNNKELSETVATVKNKLFEREIIHLHQPEVEDISGKSAMQLVERLLKPINILPRLTSTVNNSNDLENSKQIDEKELFQTTDTKNTSQNERSLIYISQRLKTPLRSHLYNSQAENLNGRFKIRESLPKVIKIPQSFEQVDLSTLQALFIPYIKPKNSTSQKYSPTYKKDRDDKYIIDRLEQATKITVDNLITSPSSKTSDESFTQETNNLYTESSDEIHKTTQEMTSYARSKINYVWSNYGFPSEREMERSSSQKLLFESDDILKGRLILDNNDNLSPLNFNDDDYNIFGRHRKDTVQGSFNNNNA